ncbi:agmatine deiminase [Perkinsela sp. CCAP 1560/4]|nr:agmatine deiminase [Perkinsela sp. CCAP 1560/4]|eukprot:KNH07940.1 agmatine deiminase [Perkinsela sp. CCAP 1560/4]
MSGNGVTALAQSKQAMSFISNLPFKNPILQKRLGALNSKFPSPYWVTVKTLKRMEAKILPSKKRSGVLIDMGDFPYNVKRMPSRYTLMKRIKNKDLVKEISRGDLRLWFNISQTDDPSRLEKYIGKSIAFDGIDGQKITDSRIQRALLSVAFHFTSPYWVTKEDASFLKLSTKENIRPIAVSYAEEPESPGSTFAQKMQTGGIYLPTLSKENITTKMFYNLDHFVDQSAVQQLRKLYPYRIFMGKKEFYTRRFSMGLVLMALRQNYTSPLWFTPGKIEKHKWRIVKDEYHRLSEKKDVRFYNRCVLSNNFTTEEVARFHTHFSLFHRVKLPDSFQSALHKSVREKNFSSNYWVSQSELQELGLTLLPNQQSTTVRSGQGQTTAYQLYNIEQTKPLKTYKY